MTRTTHVLATLALLFTLAAATMAQTTITILHLNDTHSNLAPGGPRTTSLEGTRGGIARAATLIGSVKQSEDYVLTLHAGDSFIGDMTFNTTYGAGELALLQAIGVDAMTLGNHECDLGPTTLLGVLPAAFQNGSFPLLSANLVLPDPSVQPLAGYVFPSMTRVFGTVKVGVFGLTTPATNILSNPSPAVISPDVLGIAQNTAAALKADGCDMVILLSHLGLDADRQLAYAVPALDAVLGGHSHTPTSAPDIITDALGSATPVVQSGAFYESIGRLEFTVTSAGATLTDYRLVPITTAIPEAPAVKAAVAGLINGVEQIYGPVFTQQIATASNTIDEVAYPASRPGAHDTPAGNLITDAFRQSMNTDIAICAGGSIAQPLQKGPIVAADVFRMVGYGFNTDNGLGYRMATFKMSGAALMAGLEFGVSQAELDDEYLIQVSGMKYWFDLGKPAMSRITRVRIGNRDLEPDRMYTVAASEFVPMFLTALGIPFSDVQIVNNLTEFQVVAAYITQMGVVTPGGGGRVIRATHAKAPAGNITAAPASLSIQQNTPNPFPSQTVISFALETAAEATLRVYDAAGREVALVASGYFEAGQHQCTFSANGLPSGVYTAVLSAAGQTSSRRMVLAR